MYGIKRGVSGITPLSVFKQHSQIAVITLSGRFLINIFRSFGLASAKICKYGRLLFKRYDILRMTVSFCAHSLNTFHVRDLYLPGQNVRSQPHIFGRELMAIDHQIPIRPVCGVAKRFHRVVCTSWKHSFRQG